jgi:hypothetical protein
MTTVKGYLGSVSFDGQTVVVQKKGRGKTRIPIEAVAGVLLLPAGPGMRGIKFAAEGGGTTAAPVFGSHKALANDPYALTFRSKHEASFAALAGEVERARARPRSMAPAPRPDPPSAPPAGWYPVKGAGLQRYWDGQQWTEHTAPL